MQTHNVSWKKPLALAITLSVLGGGAYWLEYAHRPKKEEGEKTAKKLMPLKDTPVAQISLFKGEARFVFKCMDLGSKLCKPGDQSKWEMIEPVKMKADDGNVNSVLSAINNLTPTDSIDLESESTEKRASLLKDYGLDEAARSSGSARTLEVTLESGEKRTLVFGVSHPIGDGLLTYSSQVGEKKAFISPGHFKAQFDHDLVYWRNKKLFTLSASQVKKFSLQSEKGSLSSERKEGAWTLSSQKGEIAGDSESIDTLITSATYLTAKKFAAEQKSSAEAKSVLQGTRSVLTLTLESESGPSTLTLFERKAKGDKGKAGVMELFATVSTLDPVFELESSSKNRLSKGLNDLRVSKLMGASERFDTKKLEFAGGAVGTTPIVVQSKDGKWGFSGEEKRELDSERLQSTLDRLTGNRIKEFLSKADSLPTEKDSLTITAFNDKDAPLKKLQFWQKKDKLFARDLLSKNTETFVVDPVVKDSLPWSGDYFVKKEASPESKPVSDPAPAPAAEAGQGHGHGHAH